MARTEPSNEAIEAAEISRAMLVNAVLSGGAVSLLLIAPFSKEGNVFCWQIASRRVGRAPPSFVWMKQCE